MVSRFCVCQTLPLVVEKCERWPVSSAWAGTSRTYSIVWAACSARITACWRWNIESIQTTVQSSNVQSLWTRRINAELKHHNRPNRKHGFHSLLSSSQSCNQRRLSRCFASSVIEFTSIFCFKWNVFLNPRLRLSPLWKGHPEVFLTGLRIFVSS